MRQDLRTHYNPDMPSVRANGRQKCLQWMFALSLMTLPLAVCAQKQPPASPATVELPSSPQKAPPPETAKPVPPTHAFWDRTNIMLFTGVGIFRGLDYASTRNMQARGREEILLADDVVNNSAGFAALEAAGTATSIGLSYWMHRSGHHTLERWVSIVHISVTGFGSARNYALKSHHVVGSLEARP